MRARYQTNPRIAVFGMALSLGLIFGAHEVNGLIAEREADLEVRVQVDQASQARAVMTVEPAARAVVEEEDRGADQRTC